MACHAQAVKAGKHYDPAKIYSGSAPVADLRMLEAIAVEKGFDIYETDVAMAFPHAQLHPRPDGKPTTMRQPEGTRIFYDQDQYIAEKFDADSVEQTTDGTQVTNGTMKFTDDAPHMAEAAHVVTRAWYGHPSAGNAFIEQLHGAITNTKIHPKAGPCPITIKRSSTQPCIFYMEDARFPRDHYWLWTNIDNVRHYGTNKIVHEQFMQWYGQAYTITGGEKRLQDSEPMDCVGMTIRYEEGKTSLSMAPYVQKMLAKHGLTDCHSPKVPMATDYPWHNSDAPHSEQEQQTVAETVSKMFPINAVSNYAEACTLYKSILMAISWYATMTGGEVKVATSLLGRVMQHPSIKAFEALKRLLRFCKSGVDNPVIYRKTQDWEEGKWPQLRYSSDASLGDDNDSSKTQGGYVGGFENQAATAWVSRLSATICTSTYHAEMHFAAETSKEMVYQRRLLDELGCRQDEPTPLQGDNAAAVADLSSNIRKFSKHNKHFTRQVRYASECVEQGHIRVVKKSGKDLTADAMTKPLPQDSFAKYNQRLHQGPANPE